MKQNTPKQVIQPTSLQQVRFNDGMIVTAEDLQDAASYPLDVFKTLIRAFFGCGIVCGLKVKISAVAEQKESWCVEVKPGVALDCYGHPIELCKPIKFDFNEAYQCDPNPPKCVCIAIRRYTTEEDPRPNPASSDEKGGQENDCTRVREHIMIKVFDPTDTCDKPKNICMVDSEDIGCCPDDEKYPGYGDYPAKQGYDTNSTQEHDKFCECIKCCPDKECCGDAWVLLACIKLGDCGVECVENRLRKYVKPIHCCCPPEGKECVERPRSEGKEKYNEPVKPAPKKLPARKRTTPKKEG